MKRQIWFYFACLVMVIGVAIVGVSVWQVWNHNHLLEKNFVEKEEMAFLREGTATVYEELAALRAPNVSVGVKVEGTKLILEHDLCYYNAPTEEKPVQCLEAGTEVYVFLGNQFRELGLSQSQYGLVDTVPTKSKGWRLAVPFYTVEELDAATESLDPKVYYVREADLRRVYRTYWKPRSNETSDRTKQALESRLFDNMDYALYVNGAFIPQRLYENYCSLGLVVGLLLVGSAALILRQHPGRRWKLSLFYGIVYAVVLLGYLVSPRFGWFLVTPQKAVCIWQRTREWEDTGSYLHPKTEDILRWTDTYMGMDVELNITSFENGDSPNISLSSQIVAKKLPEKKERWAVPLKAQLERRDKQENFWQIIGMIHLMILLAVGFAGAGMQIEKRNKGQTCCARGRLMRIYALLSMICLAGMFLVSIV